jgi:hypothetical protein
MYERRKGRVALQKRNPVSFSANKCRSHGSIISTQVLRSGMAMRVKYFRN